MYDSSSLQKYTHFDQKERKKPHNLVYSSNCGSRNIFLKQFLNMTFNYKAEKCLK